VNIPVCTLTAALEISTLKAMDTIPLRPERKAQLEEYAQRRGQDPAAALDDALAAYLEWERQDFDEAVDGIRRGHEDVKAGRTRPAAEFLAEMRQKHGIPG
jgi:predicted transcriptional regulator